MRIKTPEDITSLRQLISKGWTVDLICKELGYPKAHVFETMQALGIRYKKGYVKIRNLAELVTGTHSVQMANISA
jgi:hypothetical protein